MCVFLHAYVYVSKYIWCLHMYTQLPNSILNAQKKKTYGLDLF